MAISLTIDGKETALKKGSSIECVSANRISTDAVDYSMEIELPLASGHQETIARLNERLNEPFVTVNTGPVISASSKRRTIIKG